MWMLSRSACIKSGSVGVTMRDNRSNVIMAKSKRLGDCSIVVAECLAMCEAILMVIQNSISRIIAQSDSQLVVNSIKGKMGVPKDISGRC